MCNSEGKLEISLSQCPLLLSIVFVYPYLDSVYLMRHELWIRQPRLKHDVFTQDISYCKTIIKPSLLLEEIGLHEARLAYPHPFFSWVLHLCIFHKHKRHCSSPQLGTGYMKHVFDTLSVVHVSWIIQDPPKVAEVQRKHMLTLYNKVKMRRKAPSLTYSNGRQRFSLLLPYCQKSAKEKGQI